MSLNKFNFRTQSNQLNLIERSKPTLKVGKTLKSFLVCKETPGNQQRTKNESGETNIGLTVVYSLLQKYTSLILYNHSRNIALYSVVRQPTKTMETFSKSAKNAQFSSLLSIFSQTYANLSHRT